ncbi:MAG: rhomboid family protein [Acidobacteriota bacterium]
MAAPTDLTLQRCLVHPRREAAARCPQCRHFFCRECVVEHGDRIICAACLRRLAAASPRTRFHTLLRLGRGARILIGLFVAWLFFYFLAQALLLVPARFHTIGAAAAGAVEPP